MNDKPYGMTFGEWTVRWWQWALSIPASMSPLKDYDGKNANFNQPEKDVWFLAGTWATEKMDKIPSRTVAIPHHRSILFPIINCEANPIEYPFLKTDEDIVNHVVNDENTIVLKEAYINNITVPVQRVASDPIIFPIQVPYNDDSEVLINTRASADGYWIFLKPLHEGIYDIHFRGACEMGRLNTGANYKVIIK